MIVKRDKTLDDPDDLPLPDSWEQDVVNTYLRFDFYFRSFPTTAYEVLAWKEKFTEPGWSESPEAF